MSQDPEAEKEEQQQQPEEEQGRTTILKRVGKIRVGVTDQKKGERGIATKEE